MRSLVGLFPSSFSYIFRRLRFRITQRELFLKFQNLRKGINDEGYTLQPFDEHECIFIHIPKCAGQSVRASLFENLLPGHINVYTYQMVFDKDEFDRYFKFTIVRNPWDRLVSAYVFLKNGGAHEKDKKWSENHLSKYQNFKVFVEEGLHRKDILAYPHFRPQVKFLLGQQGKMQIDFIGHLENIQEDFSYITEKIGLNRDLFHINKTKSKRRDYRSYYTGELIEIVAKIYKSDIDAFNYDFD
jgi:hypothetical protein